MIERIWQWFKPCINWNINKCECRLKTKDWDYLVVSQNDLDKNCKGFSNPQKCSWYKYKILSDKEIKIILNALYGKFIQKRNKKQLLQKKQTKRKLPQKKIIQKKSFLGGKITEKI